MSQTLEKIKYQECYELAMEDPNDSVAQFYVRRLYCKGKMKSGFTGRDQPFFISVSSYPFHFQNFELRVTFITFASFLIHTFGIFKIFKSK